MKKRQLITMNPDEEQLLNDLAFIRYGTSDKKKSKIIFEALKKMASNYNEELKKLEEVREMSKCR